MIVYLLRIVDTDYFKVGISTNLHQRLDDIQSGMPLSVALVRSFEQENAREVERTIHQILDKYRIRGEWFQADGDLAIQAFMAGNTMGMVDAALDEPEPDASPAPVIDVFFAPTIRDKIIDYLHSSPWSPSSRIAPAIEVDINVVRKELSIMVRNGMVYRRMSERGDHADRYEYAAVNQSTVNASDSSEPVDDLASERVD